MQAKTGRAKVFYYYFAHEPPYPQGSPFLGWGAGHWAELRYVFDHLYQYQWAWSDADRELANTMATYWTNFAKTGDPNGNSVPVWPNFTTGTGRQLHFDDTITARGVQNLQRLRLLDDRFAKFRAGIPAIQNNSAFTSGVIAVLLPRLLVGLHGGKRGLRIARDKAHHSCDAGSLLIGVSCRLWPEVIL
jgi:hypothetical protein